MDGNVEHLALPVVHAAAPGAPPKALAPAGNYPPAAMSGRAEKAERAVEAEHHNFLLAPALPVPVAIPQEAARAALLLGFGLDPPRAPLEDQQFIDR
eukprot:9611497-Alexandrium_andersonii.AAC.1